MEDTYEFVHMRKIVPNQVWPLSLQFMAQLSQGNFPCDVKAWKEKIKLQRLKLK